ncbi:MAG: helix-turn-helix transcriptional regulator [Firmicutes bacterium]|nr:helix-turn-helix transcriptional regulator [Bacillota bacterium]
MKKPLNMDKYAIKINRLRNERGWSVYRLSQESGIPEQSISKWIYGSATITLPLLEQICEAFGITLADFFAEGALIELTPEKKTLHDDWHSLSENEQSAILAVIKSYKDGR